MPIKSTPIENIPSKIINPIYSGSEAGGIYGGVGVGRGVRVGFALMFPSISARDNTSPDPRTADLLSMDVSSVFISDFPLVKSQLYQYEIKVFVEDNKTNNRVMMLVIFKFDTLIESCSFEDMRNNRGTTPTNILSHPNPGIIDLV